MIEVDKLREAQDFITRELRKRGVDIESIDKDAYYE